jgi:hypothetical protein
MHTLFIFEVVMVVVRMVVVVAITRDHLWAVEMMDHRDACIIEAAMLVADKTIMMIMVVVVVAITVTTIQMAVWW